MPELEDMPPGWEESASAQWRDANSPPGVNEEPPDRWGPHNQWGGQPSRWGESGQWDGASRSPQSADFGDQPWGESSADNRGFPGAGDGWSADMSAAPHSSEWDSSGSLASVGAMRAADASGKQRRSGMPSFLRRRGNASVAEAEDEDNAAQVDPFADPSAWASPSDLDRRSRVRGIRDSYSTRPPRRWGRLLVFIMLLLVVDSALLVTVRPDLCPHNACAAVSARIKQSIAQLDVGAYFMPHSPLTTTPPSVSLQTYAGGTVSANLTLKNPAKTSADWAATATLPWLSVAPASGALPTGASAKLVLTAKPDLAVHPDTYAAQLQVKVGNTVLNVPVTIALAAAPHLSVAPATLTFTHCQTSQQVTVANTGGGPLSFTATPLESALSLDVTSATLAPGAKRKITITLDCSATTGSTYGINLVSNGGSAAITVSFS
jgi:hypothetical protein